MHGAEIVMAPPGSGQGRTQDILQRVPTAVVLGVTFAALEPADLHAIILDTVQRRRKARLLIVNAHALNLAYEEAWLRAYFNQAEVVFPDGYGAVLAACFLGVPLRQRITYADWIWDLAAFCEREGMRLFFLGAREGVAEEARQALEARNPGLQVVGTHHGYFDKRPGSAENNAVLAQINPAAPDILVVGMGMPRQERWLRDNWEKLQVNVALTGGAVFDYVSGRLPRPPRILTEHGLEWLGRLVIEPRRLWRRYLLGNPKFVWRVLRQRLRG